MKIGILGGGQLGRMFIQKALSYDDVFFTLDPSKDAPCATISHFVQGDFNDYNDVMAFCKGKDVVTIEIEHVNTEALFQAEKQGIKVIPSAEAIAMIQQKITQKEFYTFHEIPTAPFQTIQSLTEKITIPLPFVQKANTGGYDGKGVQIIQSEEQLTNLWNGPSVIEKMIEIEKELAIIVAQNEIGETKTFPITEMVADAQYNLLDFTISPANITSEVENQIYNIVAKFIQNINSAGLFTIEMLLDKNGKVWVNETAPRLHNSGHVTQEGNQNCQFEQMYRVLCNLPLADTQSTSIAGMLNLIGEEHQVGNVCYEGLEQILNKPNTFVHLYGKTQTKPGRKMGHINIIHHDRESLIKQLNETKTTVKVISKS